MTLHHFLGGGMTVHYKERILPATAYRTYPVPDPAEDEKTIDGYIAALAGAVDTAKSDPRKYSKNNQRDPFDDANKRAIDYGMKVCGS